MGSKSQTSRIKPARRELERKTWLARHAALLSVLAVIALLAMVRLRLADVPLERDEGEYAYSGQLILQGFPPYQLTYNMKFPGTYYAYSAILAVFGQSAWGIHVGLLIVNATTILLLFFLSLRLLDDHTAAAISAIAFGVLSIDRWIMGVFGHATHFVVLAAVAGLLVLYRAIQSRKTVTFVAAGAMLGISVLMKQNGIFFLALGIGSVFWNELPNAQRNLRQALFRSGLVAAGAAIPFVILCTVLWTQGVLGKFWYWTFQYAKEYVTQVSITDAWLSFTSALASITRANTLIWLVAGAGLVLIWFDRWASHQRITLVSWLIASLIAICPGFYFREHYFILLLPAAALFCGVAILSIRRLLHLHLSRSGAWAVGLGIFLVALAGYASGEWNYLTSMPAQELSRELYGANPFVEAPEIASYLQARTDPQDRIAVLGSEPQIYFYSNRKSATGYIYTYGLMEQQKYSQDMQAEMIQEVTAANPKYVVYVGIATSWLVRNPKEQILAWTEVYLNQCYNIVGIADILPDNKTRLVWDADAPAYKPQSQNVVYTLKKKSDAPCMAGQS